MHSVEHVPPRVNSVFSHVCRIAETDELVSNALKMFLPPPGAPRRRAQAFHALKLLNGDWLARGCLQHCCSVGCCESPLETQDKLIKHLPRALTSQRAFVDRSNWADWPRRVSFFGLASAVHGFLQDALAHVLQGHDVLQEEAIDADRVFHDPAAEVAQEAPQPLDIGAALPAADMMEQERREKMKSLHRAATWMPTMWLRPFWVMRVCLQPQVELMASMLHNGSTDTDIEAMHALLSSGRRPWRCLELLKLTQDMLAKCRRQLSDGSLWCLLHHTCLQHSEVIKLASRSPAIIYHHCIAYLRSFPFKMVNMVVNRSPAMAQDIINTPACFLDTWSRKMLQAFDTEARLLSEEFYQIVAACAELLVCTTYATERAHSRGARRLKQRLHAKRMLLPELGLSHMGFAAAPCIRRQWLKLQKLEKKGPRRKPGPKKRKRDNARNQEGHQRRRRRCAAGLVEQDELADEHRRCHTRGGGGPWRAFVHVQGKGQRLTTESFQLLKEQYRLLDEEERAFYAQLGARCQLLAKLASISTLLPTHDSLNFNNNNNNNKGVRKGAPCHLKASRFVE